MTDKRAPASVPAARAALAVMRGVCAVTLCLLMQVPARAAPPANDNYLASTTMVRADGGVARFFHDVVDTTEATTQADLFNPSREGLPFGGDGPEPTMCAGTSYGKTVWYDFAPEVYGGVEITAGGFDTVVTVYSYDPNTAKLAGAVTCQGARIGAGEDVLLPRVQKAVSYTVQVGGAGADAAAAAGSLDFTFRFFPDRDRDRVLDEAPDACPNLPGIPQAGGCPPRLALTLRVGLTGTGSGVRVKRFVVDHVPSGARVEARCRRCGLDQVVTARRAGPVRLSRFPGRSLRAGATIELYETHQATDTGRFRFGAIGSYARFRVGANDLGAQTKRCLMPGSRTPRRHCP